LSPLASARRDCRSLCFGAAAPPLQRPRWRTLRRSDSDSGDDEDEKEEKEKEEEEDEEEEEEGEGEEGGERRRWWTRRGRRTMASLGASWAVLAVSWRSRGPLAYLGEFCWASWGSLGSFLKASSAPLGASWALLGTLLWCSWESSGRSWGHVGGDLSKKRGALISTAPLECLESPLGLLLGRPWSALGRS